MIRVSVPQALKEYVEEQVAGRGYPSSSDYVCDLIRQDQERQRLRALLLEGASSPTAPHPVDDTYFSDLRGRAAAVRR